MVNLSRRQHKQMIRASQVSDTGRTAGDHDRTSRSLGDVGRGYDLGENVYNHCQPPLPWTFGPGVAGYKYKLTNKTSCSFSMSACFNLSRFTAAK